MREVEFLGFAVMAHLVYCSFKALKEWIFPPYPKTYNREERQRYIQEEWEKRHYPTEHIGDLARKAAMFNADWSGAPTKKAFQDAVAKDLDKYVNPTPELLEKIAHDIEQEKDFARSRKEFEEFNRRIALIRLASPLLHRRKYPSDQAYAEAVKAIEQCAYIRWSDEETFLKEVERRLDQFASRLNEKEISE